LESSIFIISSFIISFFNISVK